MPDSRNNHLLLNEWRVGDIMNVHTYCTIASQPASQSVSLLIMALNCEKKALGLAHLPALYNLHADIRQCQCCIKQSRTEANNKTQHATFCMTVCERKQNSTCPGASNGECGVCVQAQTKLKEKIASK